MIVIVNLIGIGLMLAIISWFWLMTPKQKKVSALEQVTIIVEHGIYTPNRVQVKKNQPLQLTFIRKDQTPCAEVVVFESLGISAQLPLDEPHSIDLDTKQIGEFEFTCQMGMYRGKVIVTK